jgi:hypothetical protein
MNVIDLCSWGIGASDTDEGLLLRVRGHYLSELPAVRRWGLDDDRPDLARLWDANHAQARARLFPNAAGRALVDADADHLFTSFEKQIRPLRHDRNRNRAHAFESKTTQGNAKRLELVEVRQLYTYARQILNDLCLVALGTTWAENDLNPNNVELAAEDLLDIVFLPNWFRRETAGRGMPRREIYDALHADSTPAHFNDPAKLERLADRLAPSSDRPENS